MHYLFLHRAPFLRSAATAFLSLFLSGCTHFNLEDCPEKSVLNKDVPRLRTSHYRAILQNPPAAAARFLPYAIMSGYAYLDGEKCLSDSGERTRTAATRQKLHHFLGTAHAGAQGRNAPSAQADPKFPEPRSSADQWLELPNLGLPDGCEDELGLMFNVWKRTVKDQTYVVIAFRGTGGAKDWIYGNFWWLTRLLPETQYSRAQAHARRIIQHFEEEEKAFGRKNPPVFITTGHSLGGGLAQHVLYAFPRQVSQAIVFAPSSVTGFSAMEKQQKIDGCSCDESVLPAHFPKLYPEARIIRVYEQNEILANIRFPHKLLFPPERHVQEVRFAFQKDQGTPLSRHRMIDFAQNLYDMSLGVAKEDMLDSNTVKGWYASKDHSCTMKLMEAQKESCSIKVDSPPYCPQ